MLLDKFDTLNKELVAQFTLIKSNLELIDHQPKPHKWSIGQHLYHLWLSESSIEAYIRKKTSYPDKLVSVSSFTGIKSHILLIVPKLGIKLKAPRMIVDPIPKKVNLSELEIKWRTSRESFVTLLDELDHQTLKKAIFKHPFLGRINMDMTLDFMLFHSRHHYRAIKKIITKKNEN